MVEQLGPDFFTSKFKTGLMLVIDGFEVDNFDHYFSATKRKPSYLREYVRFYTAHADVRRIGGVDTGFRVSEVTQLKKHVRIATPSNLHLWTSTDAGPYDPESVPGGWPYLAVPKKGSLESRATSPEEVPRLRDGTFFARHADSFKYEGRYYNLILAIDGKRRALEGYPELNRQSSTQSGIRFGDQRGIVLCSQGVRVCQYNQFFDQDALNGWRELREGKDHFSLFIDGPFELVTNRNLPAQSATTLLKEPQFVKNVADFLTRVSRESGGDVLRELLNRLRSEATAVKESEYTQKMQQLKDGVALRSQFRVEVPSVPALSQKWFVAPLPGEEHFVGALYTLFSHLIANGDPLSDYWQCPLTFKALGIDALGVGDEDQYLSAKHLDCIEYKYAFAGASDFNHPLTITDRIVCWSMEGIEKGSTIEDTFGYLATVAEDLVIAGRKVGCVLKDLRRKSGGGERPHEVKLLSLDWLLEATFVVYRRNPPPAKPAAKRK